MAIHRKVKIYHSFEEENQAEHQRRANMTQKERCREFGILQERMWGKKWRAKPLCKSNSLT